MEPLIGRYVLLAPMDRYHCELFSCSPAWEQAVGRIYNIRSLEPGLAINVRVEGGYSFWVRKEACVLLPHDVNMQFDTHYELEGEGLRKINFIEGENIYRLVYGNLDMDKLNLGGDGWQVIA